MNSRTCSHVTLWILCGLLGCSQPEPEGDPTPLFPVRGRLTVAGKPAAGASIRFVPTRPANAAGAPTRIPAAIVAADGSFSASYRGDGDGAPEGTYKVLVLWLEEPADGGLLGDRLKGKYFDEANPVATVTVNARDNDLGVIELRP